MRNKLTFKDSDGNIVLDVGLGIVAFSAIAKIKENILGIEKGASYEDLLKLFKNLSDDKENKLKFDDFGKGKATLTEIRDKTGPLDESDTPISSQVDDIKAMIDSLDKVEFEAKEDDKPGAPKIKKKEDTKEEEKDKDKEKAKPFSAMNDAMGSVIKMDGSSFGKSPTRDKDDKDPETDSEDDKKKKTKEDEDDSTKIKDKVEDEEEDKEEDTDEEKEKE